ncbi:hypothetical protein VPH35_066041 [Triticum aestivum]
MTGGLGVPSDWLGETLLRETARSPLAACASRICWPASVWFQHSVHSTNLALFPQSPSPARTLAIDSRHILTRPSRLQLASSSSILLHWSRPSSRISPISMNLRRAGTEARFSGGDWNLQAEGDPMDPSL